MEDESFVVIFQGRLKDGVSPEEGKDRPARRFKVSPERAEALLAGGPMVIKRGVTGSVAEKYKMAVEQAGLECAIEPDPEAVSGLEMENAGDEAKAETRAAEPACPKCGYRPGGPGDPALDNECPQCGIILSKIVQPPRAPGPSHSAVGIHAPAVPFDREPTEIIDFHAPGLWDTVTVLEYTLPDSIQLPPERLREIPAPLKRRFLAGLASLCVWVWTTFTLQIPVGIILALVILLGKNISLNRGDAEGIRVLVGLIAGVYLFIFLPWRWHGLTYGQRLMGLWVRPKGDGPDELDFFGILLRFVGTVINFSTFGVLNVIWPQITNRSNVSDTLSSSVQVEAGDMPQHPVREALRPLAYALALGILLGVVAAACSSLGTERTVQRPLEGKAVVPRTRPQAPADAQPRAAGRPPGGRSRSAASMAPQQILQVLASLQQQFYVHNKFYSNDLEALLFEYGTAAFDPPDPILRLYYSGDLKIVLTERGFEIGIRQDGQWYVVSDRGMQGRRPDF
jgi:uncharacterized RDD family membrane protein YckC